MLLPVQCERFVSLAVNSSSMTSTNLATPNATAAWRNIWWRLEVVRTEPVYKKSTMFFKSTLKQKILLVLEEIQ